ncbi:MAG: NUDIX hydrolase [Candidatus Lumbricidophila eiseniae]|uniref:NUDIX hydrolase n=1 Tax=Candidatus Lumbricidiphila eiseniae TaxID=1969409 RepID=A0A2A6FQB5_9MICO|nr:MAG: NUDIX hydrolase [Candidatus Lumbricidophila eiseniae]
MPPGARLAVSTVIFALTPDADGDLPSLRIPLVRRLREPDKGRWALPGGWLPTTEALDVAAARTLAETTGLTPKHLEQLYTFGDLDRSPGERVVSVVYWALVHTNEIAHAVSDSNVCWFDEDSLPDLAFDHRGILDYALRRLRTKLEYSGIAHALLGETFTIAQLRGVHEAVLRRRLDPANFRRTVEASGTLVDTGTRLAGTRHRPPALYRFDDTSDPHPAPLIRTQTPTPCPGSGTAHQEQPPIAPDELRERDFSTTHQG